MSKPARPERPPDAGAVLLGRVLRGDVAAFAVVHRPESAVPGLLEVLVGTPRVVASTADLPVPVGVPERRPAARAVLHDLVVVVPYRQLVERGMVCVDDGAPLVGIEVTEQATVSVETLDAMVGDLIVPIRDGGFDIDDERYGELVERVVRDEIGAGAGANFVVRRTYRGRIEHHSARTALAIFRRLLGGEPGAYWTFLVDTGDRMLVGASPERHLEVTRGRAVMSPISGTYAYPAGGPTVPGLLDFLADRKETDELYMVLDEELKMMGRICESGGRVTGPRLRQMARLAHTEYAIEGRSILDLRDSLSQTMFAPTVVGSPLDNACRVVARYEASGRGYYAGIVSLIGREADGEPVLDSAIVIRTAEIDPAGGIRLDVGATIVRHSDPQREAEETRAKAATLLGVLAEPTPRVPSPRPPDHASHTAVLAALAERNVGLGSYWMDGVAPTGLEPIGATRALVVDCEDAFTSMVRHQLTALGLDVTWRSVGEEIDPRGQELVVLGPGPGDPRSVDDPKIAQMRRLVRRCLAGGIPLLAICLGHQVLSSMIGLDLVRRPIPHQGVRREVDLFGVVEQCGFYNSYAAHSDIDRPILPVGPVQLARDPRTGEVHAMRGPGFCSFQFHPESVLTENGLQIMHRFLVGLIPQSAVSA